MSIAEKLQTVAENQQRVYDAGYTAGQSAGGSGGDTEAAYQQGVTDGKNQQWSSFWDEYQGQGNLRTYSYAFAGLGWTDGNFKPKYPIVCNGTLAGMFQESYIRNLKGCLDACGVTLDISGATSVSYMFKDSQITNVPVLNFSHCPTLNSVFSSTYPLKITTIEKIVFSTSNIHTHGSSAFSKLTSLTRVSFEGTIWKSIYFQSCPLLPASMKSIISCLSNFAGTSNEGLNTIKFSDACWTALESSGTAPDGGKWKDYVFSTLGWNT